MSEECFVSRHLDAHLYKLYDVMMAFAKAGQKSRGHEELKFTASVVPTLCNALGVKDRSSVDRNLIALADLGWCIKHEGKRNSRGEQNPHTYEMLDHAAYVKLRPGTCPPYRYAWKPIGAEEPLCTEADSPLGVDADRPLGLEASTAPHASVSPLGLEAEGSYTSLTAQTESEKQLPQQPNLKSEMRSETASLPREARRWLSWLWSAKSATDWNEDKSKILSLRRPKASNESPDVTWIEEVIQQYGEAEVAMAWAEFCVNFPHDPKTLFPVTVFDVNFSACLDAALASAEKFRNKDPKTPESVWLVRKYNDENPSFRINTKKKAVASEEYFEEIAQ